MKMSFTEQHQAAIWFFSSIILLVFHLLFLIQKSKVAEISLQVLLTKTRTDKLANSLRFFFLNREGQVLLAICLCFCLLWKRSIGV